MPDLSFFVTALPRQVNAPTNMHLIHAKPVLRYVAGTVLLGRRYLRSRILSPLSIRAHVDAD